MRPIPLPEQPVDPTPGKSSRTPLPVTAGTKNSQANKWPLGLVIATGAGTAAGLGLFGLLIMWLVTRTPPESNKPQPEKAQVAEVFSVDPAELVDVNPADYEEPPTEINPANPPVLGLPPMATLPGDETLTTAEATADEAKPKEPSEDSAKTASSPGKPTKPMVTAAPAPAAKPAPPVKPFEGFPTAITLPPVEPNKRFKLGPVKVPADYFCIVYLEGGATASRERHALSLSATPNSERDWELFAQAFNQSKSEKIADLSLKDQALWLTWTEEAAENPAASSLTNCGLKISAGSGAHKVLLRKPITVSSIPITYEKTTYDWELADAPRTDKVQVEFSMVAPKTLPRSRFVGSASVPVSNGHTTIEFGLKAGEQFLVLQVNTKLDSRGVHVTVSPWVQVTGQDKPVALTSANVDRLKQSLASFAAPLAAQLKALGNDKSTAETRAQLNKQLANVRRAQDELKQLTSLEKAFATQARLAATVTYVTDDVVVQLLKTK